VAVGNSVDVYIGGSVRAKDWEFVCLQVLGFYSTCKNIQMLQFEKLPAPLFEKNSYNGQAEG
jgi:hypothetical protein